MGRLDRIKTVCRDNLLEIRSRPVMAILTALTYSIACVAVVIQGGVASLWEQDLRHRMDNEIVYLSISTVGQGAAGKSSNSPEFSVVDLDAASNLFGVEQSYGFTKAIFRAQNCWNNYRPDSQPTFLSGVTWYSKYQPDNGPLYAVRLAKSAVGEITDTKGDTQLDGFVCLNGEPTPIGHTYSARHNTPFQGNDLAIRTVTPPRDDQEPMYSSIVVRTRAKNQQAVISAFNTWPVTGPARTSKIRALSVSGLSASELKAGAHGLIRYSSIAAFTLAAGIVFLGAASAVRSRRTDIALRRSLGAKRSSLALDYALEFGLLASFGAVLGSVISATLMQLMITVSGLHASVSWTAFAAPIACTLALGLAAGLLATWRSLAIDPAKVLASP